MVVVIEDIIPIVRHFPRNNNNFNGRRHDNRDLHTEHNNNGNNFRGHPNNFGNRENRNSKTEFNRNYVIHHDMNHDSHNNNSSNNAQPRAYENFWSLHVHELTSQHDGIPSAANHPNPVMPINHNIKNRNSDEEELEEFRIELSERTLQNDQSELAFTTRQLVHDMMHPSSHYSTHSQLSFDHQKGITRHQNQLIVVTHVLRK